jgi:hypothetical protein
MAGQGINSAEAASGGRAATAELDSITKGSSWPMSGVICSADIYVSKDCLQRPLVLIGHCFGGLVIEKVRKHLINLRDLLMSPMLMEKRRH